MLLSTIRVTTPRSLVEALRTLDERREKIRVIACGTDLIIQLKDGSVKADELLNIRKLRDLRYIKKRRRRLHIGALSTYSDIIESNLTRRYAPLLVQASRTIGAVQLQNGATIGGNLGNASPAGDSLPPLYALDASVVLVRVNGRREMPIREFFRGYRKTALSPNELIKEVHFDLMGVDEDSIFIKLGLREANAISIANVAIWVRRGQQRNELVEARVALGAVAPTIVRAEKCERFIAEAPLDEERMWEAGRLASDATSPISDIRGSAEYRRQLVVSLVYQGLYQLIHGEGHGETN